MKDKNGARKATAGNLSKQAPWLSRTKARDPRPTTVFSPGEQELEDWPVEQSQSSSSENATTPETTPMLEDMNQCLKPKQWIQAKAQLEQALSAFDMIKTKCKKLLDKLGKEDEFYCKANLVQKMFSAQYLCNMLSYFICDCSGRTSCKTRRPSSPSSIMRCNGRRCDNLCARECS